MSAKILFSLPEVESLAARLGKKGGFEKGQATIRHFPDEETYIRIESEVKGKEVLLLASLDRPDNKLLPLMFLAKTAKELGAKTVTLILPYLAYMRQDRRFNPGEAITSEIFATLLSSFADRLLTIDPHLHRHSKLEKIYSIPCKAIHAAPLIASWIQNHIENPLLVGPDEESMQWVSEVAKMAGAPFQVLTKTRLGDEKVQVSLPKVEKYHANTPVLIDDIISTGRTMIETVEHLIESGLAPPVCIGVHGIFAKDAYVKLQEAGAFRIVTCNTIPHQSNEIDITDLILGSL